jgi:Polysulphide reductase, NrfD
VNESVRTYYDQPFLKQPTWRIFIPSYFWLGGLAAGSSLLAAGADAIGDAQLRRAGRLTAFAAISASAGSLVADLGRPERFHHMLRVFRPTSPMNVGSWILAGYAPAAGVAALSELSGRAPTLGRIASWSAAAFAPAVGTYTGVLVADTAVPAWHGARQTLPALFASGAAASAGGVASTVAPQSVAGRRYAVGGALAEATLSFGLHRRLEPEVARAYTTGRSRKLHRASTAASLVGALAVGLGGRSRTLTRAGGLVIAMGAAAARLSVMEAGHTSAGDAAAIVAIQRRQLERGARRTRAIGRADGG